MIQSLCISNFQSHKHSTLDFDPGVNVIVGSSNSGKTAIIRSLRWLLTNRPGGDAFRSHWGGATKVELTTTDGDTITRSKDKENEYKLNKSVFHAFNTDVPEEIRKCLNMTEVNLQQQLDQPFLLTSTPGEVAQHFNRIAHLDNIDTSRKAIQSLIDGINRSIKHTEEELKKAQELLPAFDYLERAEVELEVLEEMETKRNQLSYTSSLLSVILSNVKTINDKIEAFTAILKADATVDILLSHYVSLRGLNESKQALSAIITNHRLFASTIGQYDDTIAAEKDCDSILSDYAYQKQVSIARDSLQTLYTAIQGTENRIGKETAHITQLTNRFNAAMPSICPLCDTPRKNETHNHS